MSIGTDRSSLGGELRTLGPSGVTRFRILSENILRRVRRPPDSWPVGGRVVWRTLACYRETASPQPTSEVEMEDEILEVLVVSKEEGAAARTVGLLERHGFVARPAADESEALGEARVAPPDIVLVDLTSGVSAAFARSIRANAVGKQPLVIAVADRPAGINNRVAADAGVDLHLVAPVHPAVIVRILKRFQRGLSLTPVLKHHNEARRAHPLNGTADTNSASLRFLGMFPIVSGPVFVARVE